MNDKELAQRAKEYLSQIPKTDALIQRLLDTVITLRSILTSISCELKPDKVQTSGPKNSIEEGVARIDQLERTINARIDELIDLKEAAFSLIKEIPDLDQQNILIARYLQNMKWEVIARQMGHEIRWVYKIHGKALVQFAALMDSVLK